MNEKYFTRRCFHSVFTVIQHESAFLRAITAPLMRYAVGSPEGLLCRQITFVPSISPISIRRRRILPLLLSPVTVAVQPSGSDVSFILFIYMLTSDIDVKAERFSACIILFANVGKCYFV